MTCGDSADVETEPERCKVNQLAWSPATAQLSFWFSLRRQMFAMRSSLAALAVCASALAHTNILLSTGPESSLHEPVIIEPSDAHRVLSHHLNMRTNALPELPMAFADHPNLWHHLKRDQAHYDASSLFEPEAPADGNVIVTIAGGASGDGSDIAPQSLTHTHTVDAKLRESFDALAKLYEKTANGAHEAWKSVQDGASSSLDRLRAELAHISDLVHSSDADLKSISSARIQSLADVEHEHGAHSQTYLDAKDEVKHALEELVQRVKKMAGAGVAVVYTSDANEYVRRAVPQVPPMYNQGQAGLAQSANSVAPVVAENAQQASAQPYNSPKLHAEPLIGDPLHVFRPSNAPQQHAAQDPPPSAGPPAPLSACPASREELERATNMCSGHGTPVQSAKGGRVCWRCACKRTAERGRATVWSGAACEKHDYSAETLLFLGTGTLLFATIVASCALLYGEGKHPLPGTLSSVSVRS